MTPETILRTIQLTKSFKNRLAVDDLNLTIARGEVFGFLGPNGAGKSTTIRMILSLIAPTRGTVELFGLSMMRHRREVLSRVGGLVESADFYSYLSGRKNLEIVAALMQGIKPGNIDEVLDIVGLAERANDKVKTYSHGMKQRLGIAQALLGNPEFIVLDEPTTGLDPQGIKEVRHLIRSLSADRAITIFLSSHLLSEIEQTATSMAIINAGKLVVQGKVHELLTTGGTVVRVDARPVARAAEILARQSYVADVRRNDQMLEVTLPAEKIGTLNGILVAAGLEVRALIPKRSLEEYFLSLTEGAAEPSAPPGSVNNAITNRG
jgi:ABC-type multidrug transport system ATPase subunit